MRPTTSISTALAGALLLGACGGSGTTDGTSPAGEATVVPVADDAGGNDPGTATDTVTDPDADEGDGPKPDDVDSSYVEDVPDTTGSIESLEVLAPGAERDGFLDGAGTTVEFRLDTPGRVELVSRGGDADLNVRDASGTTLCASVRVRPLDACNVAPASLPVTVSVYAYSSEASYVVRALDFAVEGCDFDAGPQFDVQGQRTYDDIYLSAALERNSPELLPRCSDPLQTNEYYRRLDDVRADGGTFPTQTEGDWRLMHGFVDENGRPATDIVTADYINSHDLGFGREMACRDEGDRYPCIVVNSNVGDDPENPRSPTFIASVAMERVPRAALDDCAAADAGCEGYFTAFHVFGGADGRRLNAIDLDRTGNKSVPESCNACHFGGVSPGDGTPDPFVGGQYLPFDVKLFADFPGAATVDDQLQDGFVPLNRVVRGVAENRDSNHYSAAGDHADIAREIDEWLNFRYWTDARRYHPSVGSDGPGWGNYCVTDDGPGEPQACDTGELETLSTANYYRGGFYATYCRTCHIAQAGRPFGESAGLEGCALCHTSPSGGRADRLEEVLCSDGFGARMPNARVTHRRLIEDDAILENMGLDISCVPSPPIPGGPNDQPGD